MLFLILCSNSIFNINVDWLGGGDKNQNDLTCLLASLAWFSLKSTSTWTQTSLSLLGSQNLGYFRWLKGLFLVGIPSLGHLGHFIRCQRVHLHFQGFFFLICYHHCLCGLQVHKEGYKFPCRTMFHLAFGHSPHEIMPPLADVTSSHATWSIISLVTLLVISCNTSFISTSCCPLRNILQTFFPPFFDGKLGCVKRCCDLYYFQVPHITIDDNILNFEFDENIIFSYELESHFSLVFIRVQGCNLFHFPLIHTRSQDITSNTTYHIINNQHTRNFSCIVYN